MPLNLVPQAVLVYLLLCGLAGFFGRHRRIGFWGFFFLSVMATPLLTMIFIFTAAPARRPKRAPVKRRA